MNQLHVPDCIGPQPSTLQDPKFASLYLQQSELGNYGGWCQNARMLLQSAEEESAMGINTSRQTPRHWIRQGEPRRLEVPVFNIPNDMVTQVEEQLHAMVVSQTRSGEHQSPPYPLLEVSLSPDICVQTQISSSQELVTQKRKKIEQYLLQSLHGVPEIQSTRDGNCSIRRSFRMLRSADGAAAAGLLDLVEAALHAPDHLLNFNPFLSEQSCQVLHQAILTWLQLCVLEDRLKRLELFCKAGATQQLIQELQVRRQWSVADYPEWLVFEVEGGLQIRPQQYAVARRLIHEPGAIAQLNMGEGKTRVILPMLVLHLAKGKHVVRLNFLSTLLSEAGAHLHNHICASVLGRKVFIQPFSRDVELTVSNVKSMTASLLHCQKSGSILIVAREHRLSLQLKAIELRAKGDTQLCSALDALAALPYIDILDESDELLHHRYQLIYAVGARSALPSRQQRAETIQCLLHAVSHQMDSSTSTVLSELKLDVWTSEPNRSPGSFCRLRLVSGRALEEVAANWHLQLATALMNDPPYALSWIRGCDERKKATMLDCILCDSRDASEFLGQLQLLDYQKDQLLVLRGLLARNVLRHLLGEASLSGLWSPSARKRIAVPYRAANTPSERSEYAQPDVALTLTMLAYYSDGLSREEFHDAVRHLLQMGKVSQRYFYNTWLALARSRIPQEDLERINDVAKLDDSNPQQIDLLFKYYSHNMACVDFWLNFIVFKEETQQYPQRVAHHSWHMADNPSNYTVGFSGTNDNHRLLPLQVHQATMEERDLKATNGKMLNLILENKRYISLLADDHQKLAWQLLLDTAVQEGHHALIDCGAILADTSNRNAADYVLPILDPDRFKGVVYFDTSLQLWMALERRGRCQPKQSSPLAERDAFVIFDDARCRGADMKLRSDAVGLLTMGPGMVKDKMMQAAGRLRQLDKGQGLCLVGTADVSMKIAEFNNISLVGGSISSLQVLKWVMHNTVQATIHGEPEWAHQGLHFIHTTGRPDRLLQPEVLELDKLYADGRVVQDLSSMVQDMAKPVLRDRGISQSLAQMVPELVDKASLYGQGQNVLSGLSISEECKRELEKEEEEEEEVERQAERVEPCRETDWSYEKALFAQSISTLQGYAPLITLQQMVHDMLRPKELSAPNMDWSSRLYCTQNFAYAVCLAAGPYNEYLRPVESFLLLPDGCVVLLSEREADAIQELACELRLGGSTSTAQSPQLMLLCYAQQHHVSGETKNAPSLSLSLSHRHASLPPVSTDVLVSLGLLNGDTSFGETQVAILREFMTGKRESAEELVGMRGKQSLLPRSELDKVVNGML
eukprot:gene16735-23007_t